MPANVTDHAKWARAKKAAEKQGQGSNYALVTHIYQQMGGGFTDKTEKSMWPNYTGTNYVPGQVPRMTIPSELTKMPEPYSVKRRLEFTDPVLRPEGVTSGLGLSPAQERQIQSEVVEGLKFPELNFRQRLLQKLQYLKLEYPQRNAIAQRARVYYRDHGNNQNEATLLAARLQGLRKAEDMDMEQFHIVEKAEARGGKYVARVAKKGGTGFQYFYDEEKYAKREDAHLSGRSVLKAKCKGELCKRVGKGAKLSAIVEGMRGGRYDDELVKDAIRAAVKDGTLIHEAGMLKPRGQGDGKKP